MRCYIDNFFKRIKSEFDGKTSGLLNQFIKATKANIRINIRIRFLKACQKFNLTPHFLNIHNTYRSLLYDGN